VEAFRRNSNGSWALIPYGLGETIELASLGIRVPMESIYEDVVLEQDAE
jgi:asparagine synthetase A